MTMDQIKINEAVHESTLVLANAGELAAVVISKIAGNDISTAVNGSELTRGMIQNLVARGIQRSIERRMIKH